MSELSLRIVSVRFQISINNQILDFVLFTDAIESIGRMPPEAFRILKAMCEQIHYRGHYAVTGEKK